MCEEYCDFLFEIGVYMFFVFYRILILDLKANQEKRRNASHINFFFFKLGGKQRAHLPKYITQKKIDTKKEKGDRTKPSQA